MSISYENLDTNVRRCMIDELDLDIAAGSIYLSPRLTDDGVAAWPNMLREAFEQHDDAWLESTIREKGYILAQEQRRKPKGGVTMAKVPITAPGTLAEGEFNRYYTRGLCVHTIACGESSVEICRGKDVANPRPESEAMIGSQISAQALLEDLRASSGVEPALGLPPGPNSGLTIRRK